MPSSNSPQKNNSPEDADLRKAVIRRIDEIDATKEGCSLDQLEELSALLAKMRDFVPEPKLPRTLNTRNVAEVMGANFVGPEDYYSELNISSIGKVSKLPASITPELLNSECPIAKNGSRIKETHILAFIPERLEDEPLSLSSLRGELRRAHDIFTNSHGYHWGMDEYGSNRNVYLREQSAGEWLLIPKPSFTQFENKSRIEQMKLLEKLPEYRVARALEITTAFALYTLKNAEVPCDWVGRCKEFREGSDIIAGAVGRSPNMSLKLCTVPEKQREAHLTLALVRKLGRS